MARIEITQAMQDALNALARAERIYRPGRDSSSLIELPKLALADATRAAVDAQQQTDRLARLPQRAQAVAATVRRRPSRRRA